MTQSNKKKKLTPVNGQLKRQQEETSYIKVPVVEIKESCEIRLYVTTKESRSWTLREELLKEIGSSFET